MDASPIDSTQHYLAVFLQVFSMCSINIFGLISGYVGYGKKIKIQKILRLWLQVVFWTVIIYTCFVAFSHAPLNITQIRQAIFPITSNVYWYITAYFIVWVSSPLLNFLVRRIRTSLCSAILFISVIVISVIKTTSGNNAIWLILCYLIGAQIKKTGINKDGNWRRWVILFLVCVVTTWAASLVQEKGIIRWNRWLWTIWGGREDGLWPSSISMLLGAIFVLFAGMNIHPNDKTKRILNNIVPLILSVYIIHVNPHIFQLISGSFTFLTKVNIFVEFGVIVITSFSIFIVSIILDYGRSLFFSCVETAIKKRFFKEKLNE